MRKTSLAFISLVMFALASIILQVGAQQATIYVYPESQTVPNVDMDFVVNIMIQNVTDLFGWELKLYYPNDILNGTNVTEGPFLKSEGVFTLFMLYEFTDSYNDTHGRITALCTRYSQTEVQGVNGSGVLVTVGFNSRSIDGPTILHLESVKLSDSNVKPIPYVSVDGEVQVIPEFPAAWIIMLPIALSSAVVVFRKSVHPSSNRSSQSSQRF